MFKLSGRSEKRLEGVHPDLVLIIREALKVSPIDFGIPADGGMRSAERQEELFHKGVSRCNGTRDKSKHQFGLAFDFYAYITGRASWEKEHLCILYGVFHAVAHRLKKRGIISHGIKWGGTFGSVTFQGWDMGHIELTD